MSNIDIQAILNAIDDDSSTEAAAEVSALTDLDLSSLSVGGVFAPGQIAAAVAARQQGGKKPKRGLPARRELDIEQILREADEFDNVDDVVNALLRQHTGTNLLLDEEGRESCDDEGSMGSSTDEFLQARRVTGNTQLQLKENGARVNHCYTDDDTESESWGGSSSGLDDDMDQLSKSTISTKLGNPAALLEDDGYFASTSVPAIARATAKKPTSRSSAAQSSLTHRNGQTGVAHNARDWAMLQSILAENDEEEDQVGLTVRDYAQKFEKKRQKTAELANSKAASEVQANNGLHSRHSVGYASGNLDVDLILQSMEDDDGGASLDDEPYAIPPKASSQEAVIQSVSTESFQTSVSNSKPNLIDRTAQDALVPKNYSTSAVNSKPPPIPGTVPSTKPTSGNRSPVAAYTTTISDSITTAALTQAQLYETRLLRGHGRKDGTNKGETFTLVSPLSVKRRMKPKLELWTKSRQKSASDAQHDRRDSSSISKFDFSGVLDVTPLSQISNHMTRTSASSMHNLPTALAVSPKFLCLGTQSGYIYIYDMFEQLRQTLSPPYSGDSNPYMGRIGAVRVSVTSMDVSVNGEALLAGYSSGIIILWDTFTGKPLKTCSDVHTNSPVTSLRFLPTVKPLGAKDAGVSSEGLYAGISVDASGLVNKLVFTKSLVSNLWGGGYSVEVECLLDGTAGQILALEILPSLSQIEKEWSSVYEKNQHFMRRVVLIGLSSIKSSFVVAVEPTICVLHRWSKAMPTDVAVGVQEDGNEKERPQQASADNSCLPCLAWGWSLVSGGGNVVHPILARAWGLTLQLLRANYMTPLIADATGTEDDIPESDTESQWPAFGVLSDDEFITESPIISVQWINERSLAYLTADCEFTVIDTVCMTLLERLDFTQHKLVYAELKLSGSPTVLSTTFANSIRNCVADQRLYVTCQHSLIKISLQSTKKLILDKEANGEWLQALALALDYYENYVQVLEDRLRQQDWDAKGRDMRWHPEFKRNGKFAGVDADEWITMLLLRYLKLAVENAPVKHGASTSWRAGGANTSGRIDLTLSHYTMLAGVCVEYCIGTRRLNVLYQQVYPTFIQTGYESVFFNVLEPYVLKDALKYMSPEVLAAFVEHCKKGDLESVERCLLHLDVTIMDFDSILPILKKNEMYSALLHVFTHGLDDYITPLEILLEGVMDESEHIGMDLVTASRRLDGVFQNKFEQFGYKALLYLTYCFQGRKFPGGSKIEQSERVQTLRPQLLKFLLQTGYNPSSAVRRSGRSSSVASATTNTVVVGRRADPYPYLSILVLVDAKAVLDAFSLLLDSADITYEESSFESELEDGWDVDVMQPSRVALVEDEGDTLSNSTSNVCPDRQLIVAILASLIRPTDTSDAGSIAGARQTRAAKNAFLDFVAKYLERGIIRAPRSLTHAVLVRMSHAASKLPKERSVAQGSIIALIQALPPNAYDLEEVLPLMEEAQMTRAALLLHKVGADAGLRSLANRVTDGLSLDVWEACFSHFVRAIQCYIDALDEGAYSRTEIFDYIKTYHAHFHMLIDKVKLKPGDVNVANMLRRAVLAMLPKLVLLDAVLAAQLVAELFMEDLVVVVECLQKERDGEILFEFLRAVVSGQLTTFDSVAGPVLTASLGMDHQHLYLKLMAKFHPEMVYRHLLTHGNYRPEECLKLCQEHDIPDATAYLLERTGNVSSALQLLLQTLESRMMTLKRMIRGIASTQNSNYDVTSSEGLRRMLRGGNETKAAFSQPEVEVQRIKQLLVVALDLCERNSGGSSERNEHGSQLWFNVLDRLINAKALLRLAKELPHHAELVSDVLRDLLQLTMQRMVSKVPLTDLLQKITSDHSGNRLGEFREMLMSMLKTYNGELDICSCAMGVMQVDVQRMSTDKRHLKLRGMEVRSVMGQTLGKGLPPLSSSHESSVVLKVGSNGDAMRDVSNISVATLSVQDGTSTDALTRLRKRRRQQNNGDLKRVGVRSSFEVTNLSYTTLTDHHISSGLISDFVHLGQRHVGILTDAEHFGSLGL